MTTDRDFGTHKVGKPPLEVFETHSPTVDPLAMKPVVPVGNHSTSGPPNSASV